MGLALKVLLGPTAVNMGHFDGKIIWKIIEPYECVLDSSWVNYAANPVAFHFIFLLIFVGLILHAVNLFLSTHYLIEEKQPNDSWFNSVLNVIIVLILLALAFWVAITMHDFEEEIRCYDVDTQFNQVLNVIVGLILLRLGLWILKLSKGIYANLKSLLQAKN